LKGPEVEEALRPPDPVAGLAHPDPAVEVPQDLLREVAAEEEEEDK